MNHSLISKQTSLIISVISMWGITFSVDKYKNLSDIPNPFRYLLSREFITTLAGISSMFLLHRLDTSGI